MNDRRLPQADLGGIDEHRLRQPAGRGHHEARPERDVLEPPPRKDELARLAPALARYRCFIHAPTGSGRPLPGGKHDIGRDESLSLARRAKVILNIHRDEFPYLEWHRMITMGIQQGAVVLSEPTLPSPGIVPGRHFLSAGVDDMPLHLERLLDTPFGDELSGRVAALAADELPTLFDLRAELRALAFLYQAGFHGTA